MASLRPCNHLMAMSDFDDREGADGRSARPSEDRLPSARPEPRAAEEKARRSGGRKSRSPRPVKPSAEARQKPTPARALAAVEAPPAPAEPDLDHATVVVDGREWVVRVVGRAGGSGPSATPLLLLGFWPDAHAEEAHVREALVVARTLAHLTPDRLETAFGASMTPPPPVDRVPEPGRRPKRGVGGGREGPR